MNKQLRSMNHTTGGRAKLRDVALQAGVSLATASNVLANKPWVSADLRSAVLESAAALGYQRRRRSGDEPGLSMLGFIIRHNVPFASDPFYSQILHAAERACAAVDLSLAHAHALVDASSLEELPPMIQHHHVQGLLVVGAFDSAFYVLLQTVGLPWVSIDRFDENWPTDCVTGSDEHGGYLGTRYLLEMGHRTPPPAMLIEPPDPDAGPHGPNFALRHEGYKRALADFGIPYDPALVPQTHSTEAMEILFSAPVPPTAIFCCNDPTALTALAWLVGHGISVPEQCSLVGYDDIYLAASAVPPLTCVQVNKDVMARQGVTHLLERIADPTLPPRHTLIGGSLVQRQSVRHLPSP